MRGGPLWEFGTLPATSLLEETPIIAVTDVSRPMVVVSPYAPFTLIREAP